MEGIINQGMDYIPEMIRILINLAMQMERQAYLQAGPYERTPERRDYANGYKPKTVSTRLGAITFDVPQVRKGDFCHFAGDNVPAVRAQSIPGVRGQSVPLIRGNTVPPLRGQAVPPLIRERLGRRVSF